MTIDEAIKYLKEKNYKFFISEKPAIQLGIEALERLETLRDILDTNLVKGLLPSETKGEK